MNNAATQFETFTTNDTLTGASQGVQFCTLTSRIRSVTVLPNGERETGRWFKPAKAPNIEGWTPVL